MEDPTADGFWALMHLYTGLVGIIVVGKRHITIVSYRRVGTYQQSVYPPTRMGSSNEG